VDRLGSSTNLSHNHQEFVPCNQYYWVYIVTHLMKCSKHSYLHLECWKFFEHMQSLLPSPSFFAGADQGATSNDAWIQTSGAFRCHLMPSPGLPGLDTSTHSQNTETLQVTISMTAHDYQTISVTAFQSAGFRKDSRIKSPKMASNGAPRVQSTRK